MRPSIGCLTRSVAPLLLNHHLDPTNPSHVLVDQRVRKVKTYPAGFMDVVSIPKRPMRTSVFSMTPRGVSAFTASIVGGTIAHVRLKVYLFTRLWYLRLNVIEAQDLVPSDKSRPPEFLVKVFPGNQVLKTKISPSKTVNPSWNEDLLFVAAEPIDEPIILTVENKLGANKEEILGRCLIPVRSVATRIDIKPVPSKWYNLEKHLIIAGEQKKEVKFASRIHLRICLEGGYHVTDESTHHSSDHRPSSKRLWKATIGILELGILSTNGLIPIKTRDGKGSRDAFWEVFDICTVVTIGAFDNGHVSPGGGGKDSRTGKVRIRLSTLESDRVYTHSYLLLVLHPSGVKKMGELHLAVRFMCSSWVNMLHMYSQPLLPKMHYLHPLPVIQHRFLRHRAMQIVATRLSRAEPALKREVVEYMLNADSHLWSMRKCLIGLRTHPHCQHQLTLLDLLAPLIFKSVPLRRQWAIWRRPFRDLIHIECNFPYLSIHEHGLILDGHFNDRCLCSLLSKGEDLVPFRI
ncbi:hypothetical protein MLD38_026750 [Melastoma candidum]|uniref:Uncharacterized protein n=1 Tax=Melastoma candidum TaxID=119954 RepID=A0ACB9P2H1_9MYRT|nr:hypothetical protein MLD38_026750 [Melastoma candidum]